MMSTQEDGEQRLLAEYRRAGRVYALAVAELEQAPAGAFQEHLDRVEVARQAADAARDAVDAFRATRRRTKP